MTDDNQIQGDIKVTGINADGGNAASSTPVASGRAQTGAGNAGDNSQTTSASGSQTTPPSIHPQTQQGSTAPTSTTSPTTPTPPVPSTPPPKKGVINLEEEAMAASSALATANDKYSVPDMVKEKFPDLMELIKTTESMNDEERDYWFQILPIMTEDQIARFREILLNEKQQLATLDKEYEQQITQLNEKHMLEWKEFETKEKRKAIEKAEAENEQAEAKKEQELLSKLASI